MTKKIHCKMLSQDIYLREHSPLAEVDKAVKSQETYYELQRDTVANGIQEKLVKVEYPINEESVNSHLQSADYRNDIVAAVNQPPRGKNLGDVTAYQEFIANDPAQALRVYQETIAKLAKSGKLGVKTDPVKDDNKQGE